MTITEAGVTKRMGRPLKALADKKIAYMNIRTTRQVRELVEAGANARGWSMASEAAHKILQSYRDDAVMRAIGVLQRQVERLSDQLASIQKDNAL